MNVICCQMDLAWEAKQANFARVRSMLKANVPPPGTLILLPEMFATGFSMNAEAIAEDDAGPTHAFLSKIAGQYEATVIAGMACRCEHGQPRNEAVVYNPAGKLVDRYAKIHSFSPYGEHEHYRAGTDVLVVDCGRFRVAPLLCYDLRFPELFRRAAAHGAEVFAVLANWPRVRKDHWRTLLQARAIENQAYVAGVNRVGHDAHALYSGQSMIVDPRGRICAEAGASEQVIRAELDRDDLVSYREEFPALRDMPGQL